MKKLIVLGALAFTACDFLPGGGGGTGGGGAGGGSGFTKGYVYVLKSDRNLYAADDRDLSVPITLTTGGGAKHPSLSFDGKRVVFIRTTATDSEISTVSVAGGMVSTVMAASSTMSARNLRNPVFTPDGLKIVFAYDEGGSSSIGIVDTDGSGFKKVAGGALAYSGISMYPDGSGVLAAAGSSTSQLTQIEKVSLTTGSGMSIVSSLGADAESIASRVVISPDGKKAAFDARLKNGGSVRTFVLDLTSKAITQLTDYPGDQGANDSSPCWRGNDKVCFSSDSGGNDQIYALPATSMKTSGGLQVAGAAEPWYGPNP